MTTRAVLTIKSDVERERIIAWARKVDIGTVVEFRKKTRSHEQNAKLHAMLGEVAEQVVWYGSKLKVEDWKNMFTASLRKAQVVPGIDPGTVVPLGIHTSTMTVDEMSNMIEAIYAFGADPEHLVVFKEPQDNSNPGEESPSASPVDDVAPSAASAGEDDPLPSSPAPTFYWLPTVARMLWSATNRGGDTEYNLDVLNNQRKACNALDATPTDAEREKAGSIYRVCKEVVLGTIKKADALKIIAGHAGIEIGAI